MSRLPVHACPYCRCPDRVADPMWVARGVRSRVADPGAGSRLRPLVVTCLLVGCAVAAVAWHRDPGSIVAALALCALAGAQWRARARSRERGDAGSGGKGL